MASEDAYKALLQEEILRREKMDKGKMLQDLIDYYNQDAEGRAFFKEQVALDKYQTAGQEILQEMFSPYGINVQKYLPVALEFQKLKAKEEIENQLIPSLLESLLRNLIGQ